MTLMYWDKVSDVKLPFATQSAQQRFEKHPWARTQPAVMEMQGDICVGFSMLANLLKTYGLDESLSGQAALDAIQAKMDEPAPEAQAAPVLATQEDVLTIMEGLTQIYELQIGG